MQTPHRKVLPQLGIEPRTFLLWGSSVNPYSVVWLIVCHTPTGGQPCSISTGHLIWSEYSLRVSVHMAFHEKNTGGALSRAGVTDCLLREKNAAHASCRHDNNILTTTTVWSTLLRCFYCLVSIWNCFFPLWVSIKWRILPLMPCLDDDLNNGMAPLTWL